MMRHDRQEEKIVAVLFYNHEKYISNELVFTNDNTIIDPAILERGDILTIVHGDKSQDAYNIYNITNYVNNLADAMHNRQI
jgi:hypothetical protein